MNRAIVPAMTTSEARGTPAMPLEVIIRVKSIKICCCNVSGTPYAWARNPVAKVMYIIDPSRLNE